MQDINMESTARDSWPSSHSLFSLRELIAASSYVPHYKELYDTLMYPVQGISTQCLDPLKFYSKISNQNAIEGAQVSNIINYSYNLRYREDRSQVADIARDEEGLSSNTTTIVIGQEIYGTQLILGTSRILCGDHLETFIIFEVLDDDWPHLRDLKQPRKSAQIGRLGFHPVLDVVDRPAGLKYRVELLRCFIARSIAYVALECMKRENVEVIYIILPPHVEEFLRSAGLRLDRVEHVRLSRSEHAQQIFQKLDKYWNLDKPLYAQPQLFTMGWALDPMR
jgi:hypothetical protein